MGLKVCVGGGVRGRVVKSILFHFISGNLSNIQKIGISSILNHVISVSNDPVVLWMLEKQPLQMHVICSSYINVK